MAETLATKLGRRIRSLREGRGLTLERLAYESDVIRSKGYLSDIERGHRLPSLTVLEGIAGQLGVEVFDLLVFPEDGERPRLVDQTRTPALLTRLVGQAEE